jgi:hypothetical protein
LRSSSTHDFGAADEPGKNGPKNPPLHVSGYALTITNKSPLGIAAGDTQLDFMMAHPGERGKRGAASAGIVRVV